MKKGERQEHILNMLSAAGQISVSDVMETLSVSDMTVRRDLNELSQRGLLIRTHGGAQSVINMGIAYERSHTEKKTLHETEKKEIAGMAASMIRDGETVFLGPGTTLEQIAYSLIDRKIRVVTNSLPVFEILNQSSSVDLILTGGEYRSNTGAFVGSVAMRALENMRFSKAFISVNGIAQGAVYTYSEAEGAIQRNALNAAVEKILAADFSKFGSYDFYEFFLLKDFDHIITDPQIDPKTLEKLKSLCTVHVTQS